MCQSKPSTRFTRLVMCALHLESLSKSTRFTRSVVHALFRQIVGQSPSFTRQSCTLCLLMRFSRSKHEKIRSIIHALFRPLYMIDQIGHVCLLFRRISGQSSSFSGPLTYILFVFWSKAQPIRSVTLCTPRVCSSSAVEAWTALRYFVASADQQASINVDPPKLLCWFIASLQADCPWFSFAKLCLKVKPVPVVCCYHRLQVQLAEAICFQPMQVLQALKVVCELERK